MAHRRHPEDGAQSVRRGSSRIGEVDLFVPGSGASVFLGQEYAHPAQVGRLLRVRSEVEELDPVRRGLGREPDTLRLRRSVPIPETRHRPVDRRLLDEPRHGHLEPPAHGLPPRRSPPRRQPPPRFEWRYSEVVAPRARVELDGEGDGEEPAQFLLKLLGVGTPGTDDGQHLSRRQVHPGRSARDRVTERGRPGADRTRLGRSRRGGRGTATDPHALLPHGERGTKAGQRAFVNSF